MPRTRPNAKRATKPAHRPTKFTADLGERICELMALGWFMKDAARHKPVGFPFSGRASRFRYRDCRCHRSVYLLTADAGVVRMSTYRVMGHLRRTRKVRRDLQQTTGVSDHPSIWLSFRL